MKYLFIITENDTIGFDRILLAAMEKDRISVKKLAKAAGVSPTIIQGLRTGNKTNITVNTLSRILDTIGYQIILAPKNKRTSVNK